MISAELSTRADGGHLVVALRGELDAVDADRVAAALAEAVARNPRIIVDLTALDFIDCCALHVLSRARAQARKAGGDLLLAAPGRQVRRVLALTGVFSIHAGVARATLPAVPSRPVPAQRVQDRAPRAAEAQPGRRVRALPRAQRILRRERGHRSTAASLPASCSGYDYTIGFALSDRGTVNELRVQDPAARRRRHDFLRSLPADAAGSRQPSRRLASGCGGTPGAGGRAVIPAAAGAM